MRHGMDGMMLCWATKYDERRQRQPTQPLDNLKQ